MDPAPALSPEVVAVGFRIAYVGGFGPFSMGVLGVRYQFEPGPHSGHPPVLTVYRRIGESQDGMAVRKTGKHAASMQPA